MMFQSTAFDSFFAEAVTTLKPYLRELVCIGGCANALYRFHDSLDVIAQDFVALEEKFQPWLKKFLKLAAPLFTSENAEGPAAALRVFNEARSAIGFKSENLTGEMIYRSVAKLLAVMK